MNDLALYDLLHATLETIYIVSVSSLFSLTLGFFMGLAAYLTKPGKPLENKTLRHALDIYINITRSIPFIILMITLLPITRFLVGTTIGTNAAIVPLVLAASPFFARVAENAFSEVPASLYETAQALGATHFQYITKILVPESLSSIIRGATLTMIGIVGYSAMAGAVGGGGLGELAINYGYQRFNTLVTLETVIVLIAFVQLIQLAGDYLAKKPKRKPLIFISMITMIFCVSFALAPLLRQDQHVLKVGVLSGWSEDILKVAQKVAAEKYHLHLKPVIFTDYVLPNTALENGDIDANIFQHAPYLKAQNKAMHQHLITLAKTFVYPMGFYSKKITSILELPNRGIIALPNDPSNQARALQLLQKSGVITLKNNTDIVSLKDIRTNPKRLQFKLIDAAQIPRTLQDVDLAAITNDFLGASNLEITDALLKEDKKSLYANIIAVRENDAHDENLQLLAKVMHSKPVIEATYKIFPNGAAIAAW